MISSISAFFADVAEILYIKQNEWIIGILNWLISLIDGLVPIF